MLTLARLKNRLDTVIRKSRPTGKNVYSDVGTYFFGLPPTSGNRRLLGLKTEYPEDEEKLYVTRLDAWSFENGKTIKTMIICQTTTFDALRSLLREFPYFVSQSGWEARLMAKDGKVSTVVLFGEYGPPYQD